MYERRIISIFTCPEAGSPMEPKDEVHAVPGKGLVEDRYFNGSGYYSHKQGADRQVTLIESETFESIRRDFKIEFEPRESRRNIITENVALNHLVGREFQIGEVVLRGVRLSFPCDYITQSLLVRRFLNLWFIALDLMQKFLPKGK
jgi:MOSC domain-containing protein YiiM